MIPASAAPTTTEETTLVIATENATETATENETETATEAATENVTEAEIENATETATETTTKNATETEPYTRLANTFKPSDFDTAEFLTQEAAFESVRTACAKAGFFYFPR